VLSVDATDIRAASSPHEDILSPVNAYYEVVAWRPRFSGPIEQIGGLTFTVDGKVLLWRMDPLTQTASCRCSRREQVAGRRSSRRR
jgi:hypothetical protein